MLQRIILRVTVAVGCLSRVDIVSAQVNEPIDYRRAQQIKEKAARCENPTADELAYQQRVTKEVEASRLPPPSKPPTSLKPLKGVVRGDAMLQREKAAEPCELRVAETFDVSPAFGPANRRTHHHLHLVQQMLCLLRSNRDPLLLASHRLRGERIQTTEFFAAGLH